MSNIFTTNTREPWWKTQDWVLTLSALSLSLIGTLLVWAATRPRMIVLGEDPNSYLKRHLLTVLVGLFLGWALTRMKYGWLRAYTPFLYGAGIIGLVIVLLVAPEINGIRAWIQLPGGFTLQPSEFAKLAIVVGMALVLSETLHKEDPPGLREVVLALGVAAVPVLLIMLQPDLGTTLVIGVMVLGMLAISGAPAKWLVGLASAAVVVAVALWFAPGVMSDYQKDRILVFIDPSLDPEGAGYNLRAVRLAIGSGGWLGAGLFNGPQTNGRFVPEQQTDFIYSAAGEEFGFLGAGLIILLMFLVIWRASRIAVKSQDRFAQLTAAGVAIWISFQAFENIGMNLGIMPMTGVPLPFVSYGGSSMFALWMAIGLLQNVRNRRSD